MRASQPQITSSAWKVHKMIAALGVAAVVGVVLSAPARADDDDWDEGEQQPYVYVVPPYSGYVYAPPPAIYAPAPPPVIYAPAPPPVAYASPAPVYVAPPPPAPVYAAPAPSAASINFTFPLDFH